MSNKVQVYFREEDIKHIITRGHANVAERQIRTMKDMLYKRYDATKEPWHKLLYPVLLTYNNKRVHTTTKMTPAEAMKPQNHLTVKLNLEMARKKTRNYPNVSVGSEVRIYRKKDKLDKERKSVWSEAKHKVESITESMGQNFYKVDGYNRKLLRHEILLV